MLCQLGEEERGDVDTAETVQRGVQSPSGARSAQRTQNCQRISQHIRGASDANCALEAPSPKGDARDFLGTTRQARARPGGVPSAALPTHWTTQSGVGLAEKKSWPCLLRRSGSGLNPRMP